MIRRKFIHPAIAIILSLASYGPVLAQDGYSPSLIDHTKFDWPRTDPNAIPDARLYKLVAEARERAEQASALAEYAEELATMFETELKSNNYTSEILSDGVTFTGRNAPHAGVLPDNVYVGKMNYDTGAELIGAFDFTNYPSQSHWGTGIGKAPENSPMKIFSGQFAVPADIRTRPAEGIANFRNGDKFTGTYYLYFDDTDAIGIYEDAKTERRFVGKLKTVDNILQPKKGIVESKNGQLLAVFYH